MFKKIPTLLEFHTRLANPTMEPRHRNSSQVNLVAKMTPVECVSVCVLLWLKDKERTNHCLDDLSLDERDQFCKMV
eukprot:6476100-Amphidinium_carterae.1